MLLMTLTTSMFAQSWNAPTPERTDHGDLWWKVSTATLVAASAADLHSSWGKCCERNVLLASPDRTFSTRGAMIKTAALGGQISIQTLLRKKSPKLRTLFTIVNFGATAAMSMVAAHNYGVPQPLPGGPR